MRRNGKYTSIAIALLLAAALAAGGCGEQPSLAYDSSGGNVVVQVESGGGLAPFYLDTVPSFRAFGDGRVVKAADDTRNNSLLLEGTLGDGGVEGLLESIEKAGFFDLKDSYRDDRVMDGVTVSVTVSLKDGRKKVDVYMTEVPEFAATLKAVNGFPVTGEHPYVPEEGYLYVTRQNEPPKDPRVPPDDIAALIPGVQILEPADSANEPVVVPGGEFVKIKEWEVTQKYSGLDVLSGGTWFKVYPVYEKREY
ncbi:MAG: hypothetical protein KKF41_16335 [Actinobacteria bacterium]|nr:hypothetical protein [Actinomycetota bacterium]MBU1944596.1 hypothetical protein [Actinomycetota bacterium]MBU2689149.1 hypothetical protein [Actinomycetota bacterium]